MHIELVSAGDYVLTLRRSETHRKTSVDIVIQVAVSDIFLARSLDGPDLVELALDGLHHGIRLFDFRHDGGHVRRRSFCHRGN